MKNYLMKQAKKSCSLFLAVLMLMSCWVWVAPEKAEAGAPTNYTLEMNFTVSDACNGGTVKADVTHVANNGTGSATTTTWDLDKCESDTGTYSLTKDFSGFPTKIVWSVSQGGARTQEIKLNYFKINGTTILQGGWTLKPGWWGSGSKTMEKSGEVVGGDQGSPSVNSWPTPKLESASVSLSPTSHTLARINSGISSTSTITLSGHKDQYGVNWTGPITNTFTLRTDGDVNVGSSASSSGSGNSRTITITPWFQTYFPGKQNAKLYIDWTTAGGSGKKTGTETITVDFPTYKATFHANGGKIGADDTEAKDSIEYTGEKMNIGSVIGKAPAYATKTGFEFKGFYSTQNADATGKTASFSGTLFEDDVTIIPAATSGNGDTNWYAAWQALPITATFMTADNQLIGTVEGRYNNYMTASNMYNGDAGLNAAVKASHTSGKVKFNSNNEPIYTDGSTNFTFAGWKIIKAYDESVMDKNEDTVLKGDVTFQAVYTKADAKTYTVSFEDGNGNIVSTKSGYAYRADVTNIPATDPTRATDDKYEYQFIGWAKDIGKNFYTVDESDKDENGATIAYTHKDGAEFIVKGDASYVPVFRMIPREYKVTYNFTGDNNTPESTDVEGYHWHDVVKMPEIKDNYTADGFRYYIDGWQVNGTGDVRQLEDITVEGDMVLTAHYDQGIAAEYVINFYGKAEDGVTDIHLNSEDNIYNHGEAVKAPEVPQIIDTDASLYTFAGWSPAVNTSASGDADYYATYTKKDYADIHFYNYDGTLIYELDGKENNLFIGEKIPAYKNFVENEDGTSENVLPSKETDVVGSYNFTGWKDGSGNVVVPGTDVFTGDTYLTAQFETVYKDYTVKFVNEGSEVLSKKYHYGDEITVPDDPTKEADVEYEYSFRAWTPDVSKVCYGDATYEATYRRTPQYYKVTWFKDNKTVHSTSNYKYNQKIQQAIMNAPVAYEDAETGKTWSLKHWVQCDENGKDILVDGKQVIFQRGQKMGAEALYFYPVFEQVDNVLTVTFYKEDGTSYLGEAKIPYGRDISDYDEEFKIKAPKLSDATYHYVIHNWVNINGGAEVTTIRADVKVKATYTAEAHDKKLYETVAEPTANVPGYGHYKCDVDECTSIDYNVAIAPVADTNAPTGQFYVGTNLWTLNDYTGNAINYDDVKYVSPNTNVIVNADDIGTVSEPWNSDGKLSRGVGLIEYYIHTVTTDEKRIDPTTITQGDWTAVYNCEEARTEILNAVLTEKKLTLVDYTGYNTGDTAARMKKAEIDREVDRVLSEYKANATGVLSNLGLADGEEYVIYIRISDREGTGEVNRCYLSSGTISFGSKAAEIAVSGNGYGTKFCAEAQIKVTDDTDGFKALLDGEEVTLENGEFICDTKGVHTVTVIDKHGNKTTKIFEIKGSHSYRNYITAATCENAGSRYDLCTVCGAKANEETLPALGHRYTENFVDKAPDCIKDGYRTYICDNNCGTKLVLKPTDDAATIAQASKWDETAGENGEGAWVALTADDLKDLKATGEHTYAKVKDADGNDTAEDAWTVDKAATCSVKGSKHKDCTICGETVTAEIPVDTVNGHKFYREKVTTEPTCTTKGEKTKTCRYCGEVVHVADIDALGHTAGEYRVILEPTCTAKGSKILTCAVCNADIGEPVKDKEGEFDGKAVEIPALGHKWKIDGEVYSVEEDGVTVWYQNYKCSVCDEIDKRKLDDYKPPVAATITFDFNGGYYTVPEGGNESTQTISTFVGEAIVAADVEKALKDANATKTYTFSHWEDAEGQEVKFPIEVKGDATFKAVYAERFVNYTVTYYMEDGKTEYKKTGYLHNGDTVALADAPAIASDWQYSYKFAGWAMYVDKLDENGKPVVNTETGATVKELKVQDTVVIDGANVSLFATYNKVLRKYAVTYAYSSTDILETFEVNAGETARNCAIEPEKDADSKYHYTFKAWNKADKNGNIVVKSNIYTTPDFEAVTHDYVVTVKTQATCTTNRIDTYTCSCGRTYDKEIKNTALGHEFGEAVEGTDGKTIVECQREGCDYKEEDTRKFKVEFFASEDAAKPIRISDIKWGGKLVASDIPADPTKAQDKTYTYKFKGWKIGDKVYTAKELVGYEVKDNTAFVAVFEGTKRVYNVYFYNESSSNVIKIYKNIEAGDSVTFDGTAPTKTHNDNYHYTFKGWKGYEAGKLNITVANIQEDIDIYAEFTAAKHTYGEPEYIEPETCGIIPGYKYTCTVCGYSYTKEMGKPKDHSYVATENKVEPTETTDGYQEYKCSECGDTYKDTIKYQSNKVTIKVTVKHNGVGEAGVKVEIQSATGEPKVATTNANGVATFTVDKDGAYTCYVEKDGMHPVNLVRDGDGYVGEYSYEDKAECTCACHRTNFWGTIFRFFHKIIKLFTGEFKCCGNPDPMYG